MGYISLLLVLAAACACNPKPAVREWSGFLHDYSRLRLGAPGDLSFVYRNPNARWESYDKVFIAPIALELVAHLERAVRTSLGTAFKVVDTPQLRLAITDARASDLIVDARTVRPTDAAKNRKTGPLGTELSALIEVALIEGEIRDGVTGELLAQGIDRRASGAPPPLPTWEALDRELAFWADGTFARLEARAHGP